MTRPDDIFEGRFHASREEAMFLIMHFEDAIRPASNASYSPRDAVLVILRLIAINPSLAELAGDFETSLSTIGRVIKDVLPIMASVADQALGPKRGSFRSRFVSIPVPSLGVWGAGFHPSPGTRLPFLSLPPAGKVVDQAWGAGLEANCGCRTKWYLHMAGFPRLGPPTRQAAL
jgi:hypothetical protein